MGRLPVKGAIIVSSHNLRLQCPNGVQVEPVSVLAVPNQNNLTYGRRTRQPNHDPASGGQGLRRARPFLCPAFQAMSAIGSPAWIRQNLIRVLPNENVTASVVRQLS